MTFRRRLLYTLLGFSLGAAILLDLVGNAILKVSLRAVATQRLERESALLSTILRTGPPGGRRLEDLLRTFGAELDLRLTFIDPNGVVLADSEVPASEIAKLDNHLNRPEIQEAIGAGSGRSRRFSMTLGTEMSYVARRLDGPSGPIGFLRLAVPTAALELGGGPLRAAIAGMAFASFLLLAGIAYTLTRRLSSPVESIAKAADGVASGHYEATIHAGGGPEEIRVLGASLERMRHALLGQIRALTEERRLHEIILSGMREGLLAVDSERRVILANASLRRDLDLRSVKLEGRPLAEVIRDPGVGDAFQRTLRERSESRVRVEVRFPVERSFELLVAPLDSPEGRPVGALGLFLDVTRLQALERMRREFIADVSHELRTPLASLKAALENLLGPAGDDDADRIQFLEILKRNAERMQALIDDLTDLSLIETEAITLDPEAADLRACVADAVAAISARAQARGIVLASQVPAGIQVRADRRRLDQILVNVIDNAVKFNRPGGSVRITAALADERVEIAIEDTGDGIPATDLDRIFQRFYRRDRGRSREAGGTGLGLAIVKHLMRLHGGSVHAENREGGGARLVLSFPREPAPSGRQGTGVLFLCTGNACRSQMAEGFARARSAPGLKIWSAGTRARGVDPRAVAVMKEAGIDITGQRSKGIDAVPLAEVGLLVTLCGDAAERCAALTGPFEVFHWDLPDPARATGSAEEILDVFREVRDEIGRRVAELLRDPGAVPTARPGA